MNYTLKLNTGEEFTGYWKGTLRELADTITRRRTSYNDRSGFFEGVGATTSIEGWQCVRTICHPNFVILDCNRVTSLKEKPEGEVPQVWEEAEEGPCAKFQE